MVKAESISRRNGDRGEEALKVVKDRKDRKRSGRVGLEWRTKELGVGGRPTDKYRSPSRAQDQGGWESQARGHDPQPAP